MWFLDFPGNPMIETPCFHFTGARVWSLVGGLRSHLPHRVGSQVPLVLKNPPANAGDLGFSPWVGKISWNRKWQPAAVFLPGEFHGQRNLAGYSLWGHKELDTTEHECTHTLIYIYNSWWNYVACIDHMVFLVLVAQSCPTFCGPMDCSPSGSSVHGIL